MVDLALAKSVERQQRYPRLRRGRGRGRVRGRASDRVNDRVSG